ncbi:MAG: uroporphyrinogen-III synthase [Planctomycetota bacterium]|nr:MAG: uroporphyrinogen-III synthase [Planctomycetota bacterium]
MSDQRGQPCLRICCFESRRAEEVRQLIERRGGEAIIAPSMQEVPLEDNRPALDFARRVAAGEIDAVIWMTGVGAQTLLETVRQHGDWQAFTDGLQRAVQIVRGPKPAAVLREFGIRIDHQVPEPNTSREILQIIDGGLVANTDPPRRLESIEGCVIAVQEYGKPSEELYEELRKRGATVVPVAVYRWALPDDLKPLQRAIERIVAGDADVIVFTSAQQVEHVLQVAEQMGLGDQFRQAARRRAIAAIGPTAAAAVREHHFPVDIQPEHPKLGHLINAIFDRAPEILRNKPGIHAQQ